MKKYKIFIISGLVLITLFVLSVVKLLPIIFLFIEINSSDVVGSYTGRYEVSPQITTSLREGIYEGGTHSLELKSNGTYIYIYHPTDGNDVKTIDTWEFNNRDGPRVVLHGFSISSIRINNEKAGYLSLPVYRKRFRSMRIPIDDDLGYYWIKQKK